MPYFKRQGRQLTQQQRIKNLRIAIERVHVGKYYISSSKIKGNEVKGFRFYGVTLTYADSAHF